MSRMLWIGHLKTAAGRRYSYDATNKRVKTVANGITTYEFRSAQGLLLAEWKKQAGTVDTLKEHIHVAGKEVAEQQTLFSGANIQPVGWMFLQHDASGSVLSGTWAGGGLLFKENYQPYGSQINGTAPGYTQRAFAGHKQDAQDLVYMGARYYNPQIGRFLAIDPKEADPTDLHSLNRYAYANNNPYRYVDPDGRHPVLIAAGWFAAGAAVGGGFNALSQLVMTGTIQWTGLGGVIDAAAEMAPLGPFAAAVGRSSTVEGAAVSGAAAAGVAAKSVHPSTPVGRTGSWQDTSQFTGNTVKANRELNVAGAEVGAPPINSPMVIGGRQYSGHALDRMQQRGYVPSVVEDAIGSGTRTPSYGGASSYYSSSNNLTVVANDATGKVVTVRGGP